MEEVSLFKRTLRTFQMKYLLKQQQKEEARAGAQTLQLARIEHCNICNLTVVAHYMRTGLRRA